MIKNKDSLKAKISNLSNFTKIPNKYLIQNFMFESLIRRISVSDYKDKFIIKGGFLLSSIFGVNLRSTMDLDTTIKGLALNKDTITKIFNNIIDLDLNDNISFKLVNIKDIREKDLYSGYCVNLMAEFDGLKTNLIIDVTTGDVITYKEVEFKYVTLFDQQTINILSYNYETIIAEKYESILSRNIENTRMKDYYDLYMFVNLKWKEINKNTLKNAIINTSNKRGTLNYLNNSSQYINLIKNDLKMKALWNNYQKNYDYAKNILFEDTIDSIIQIENIFKK